MVIIGMRATASPGVFAFCCLSFDGSLIFHSFSEEVLSIPFFNLRFMTRGERPFGEKMSILDRLLSHDDKISYVMCAIEQEKIGVFSLFDLAFVFEFVEEGGIG